jgi:hypothetical protein
MNLTFGRIRGPNSTKISHYAPNLLCLLPARVRGGQTLQALPVNDSTDLMEVESVCPEWHGFTFDC